MITVLGLGTPPGAAHRFVCRVDYGQSTLRATERYLWSRVEARGEAPRGGIWAAATAPSVVEQSYLPVC